MAPGTVNNCHALDCDARCVGIVIAVPEPMATELRAARASFGDPMAAVIPAHITLVTTTETTDWEATLRHVRSVAAAQEPFRVTLEGTGSFRPVSPVVFLKVDAGFDECTALHKEFQSGPLDRDLAFPFHPHVTVAHDVSEASMDEAVRCLEGYSAGFTVETVGLYEHDATGMWKLHEHVRLGSAGEPRD
ncbi:2'-5' RNA ligase family protein [Arthrobacter sp. zg.Y919]|nr:MULTISPECIES: 2'-5' RNA ligase family protein [unclassified Arthrobacter]MCC9146053.1 2'-5' RNA ligase family protein [Arthrobacter sp. zg-Y919]MDK1277282.1 2'-5' RNA ligase family protein [Arthrobacter sp. zg.Y919]MDM7990581.1 2'-5' RNA ligase family protein [Arthrobacter sp. zg-Y877]WIB04487.1 2'-5' RNA ligase family protein [Arthrobacter sp. zg-Y919]